MAAGLTAVGVPGRWASAVDSAASVLAIWLLLGGITVAILRHGIFDIDVLMRRSTAYAMVRLGIRQALIAGVIDELTLDIAPVLLGSGERIFDGVDTLGFEPAEVLHSPLATHIRCRRVS